MSVEVELAKKLAVLREKKADLSEQTKTNNKEIEETQEELIQFLVEEGKKSTGYIEGVGNFSIAKERFPSVKSANMPDFLDWVKQGGSANIVKETINPQTLKSWLKKEIANKVDYFAENPEKCKELFGDISAEEAGVKYFEELGVTIFEKYTVKKTK